MVQAVIRIDDKAREEARLQRDVCMALKEAHTVLNRTADMIQDNPQHDALVNLVILESLTDILGEMIKDSEM